LLQHQNSVSGKTCDTRSALGFNTSGRYKTVILLKPRNGSGGKTCAARTMDSIIQNALMFSIGNSDLDYSTVTTVRRISGAVQLFAVQMQLFTIQRPLFC